jgi:uncharacterized caspase-like protein
MLAMRQGIWCPVVFPIAVSCVLVLCSMQIGLAAEKRVALIVGNSRYLHMNARSSARQDAADVAGAFEKLSFRVIASYDVDRASLEARVRDFGAALEGADVGVFFYAGHGAQIAGRNFLVPVDAPFLTMQTLDDQMVPLDLVYETLKGKAKIKILLIDADRNSPPPIGGSKRGGPTTSHTDDIGVGTLVSFCTQPGNVALDGTGANSPYVAALLRRIGVEGKDLATALDEVRGDVMAATHYKQIPWYTSSLQEKFYFFQK